MRKSPYFEFTFGTYDLSPKTSILVFVYQIYKFGKKMNRWFWFIRVPFEVGTKPKYFPIVFSFYEGGFRYGMVSYDFRIIPLGANFNYCYTLVFYSITNIEFGANVLRWSSFVNEVFHDFDNIQSF